CGFMVSFFLSGVIHRPSPGPAWLVCRPHDPVDEFSKTHLAETRLRHLDHGREIKLFDRCFDRARWTRRALVLPQPPMKLIELPHLSVGSPSQIAPPCVSQIKMRDLLKSTRRVKASSQLVGERLVVDEAVCACRRDGALIEVHGIERASLDTGDLSADESCTILEVLRTIRRQRPQLSLMPPNCFAMLGVPVRVDRLAPCGTSERGIE